MIQYNWCVRVCLRKQGVSLEQTLHYEDYWGLKRAPFENVPDPRFYFPSTRHEEGLHRLLYGIEARKGALMLTGEIGCGKTLLSRTLIQQHLSNERYDLALIANPTFESTDFIKEILYQLGVNQNGTKLDAVHALNDHLLQNLNKGRDTILVVDEAQAIDDVAIFEELRLLLNFQLNDRFLLTIILLGQPELRTKVEAFAQLSQRIVIRYHLMPFNAEEVGEYVDFRMQAAGASRVVFNPEAMQAIYDASGGIPRKVNTIADLALLIGYMEQCRQIEPEVVKKALMEAR
ncbi:MAG TPA: AAA family ATPase [Nitrospirales bacterium]|nr:AAA family ATPase [Nitrospirales bacterium]